MFLYHISLVSLILLSCILQQFLPPIGAWNDARILLIPLVFLCSAITIPTAGMLLLAFLGGFLWDAQHILLVEAGDPSIYSEHTDSLKFGYTIILYALMGFLMQGIQPLFQQGKWYLSAILSGIAIFFYLWVEYLLLSFVRGGFNFDNSILQQIIFTALLTMTISPIVFAILFHFAHICGHNITFDSLKKKARQAI